MSKDNSIPAFPVTPEFQETPQGFTNITNSGMSLRDYFAAKVAQGMVASYVGDTPLPQPKAVAVYAYNVADALLAEREE